MERASDFRACVRAPRGAAPLLCFALAKWARCVVPTWHIRGQHFWDAGGGDRIFFAEGSGGRGGCVPGAAGSRRWVLWVLDDGQYVGSGIEGAEEEACDCQWGGECGRGVRDCGVCDGGCAVGEWV